MPYRPQGRKRRAEAPPTDHPLHPGLQHLRAAAAGGGGGGGGPRVSLGGGGGGGRQGPLIPHMDLAAAVLPGLCTAVAAAAAGAGRVAAGGQVLWKLVVVTGAMEPDGQSASLQQVRRGAEGVRR